MTTITDRAVGALLGLAAGDAVGTTVEFKPPGTFEPLTDLVGGGPFGLQPGQWTDDTSMALCLAESLVECGGMDLADQMRRYLRWRDEGHWSATGVCFDIGNATSFQLSRFQRTGEPVDPHVDQEAAANGSLMRLAPVAIRWQADPRVAAERAAESSLPTHPAERPIDSCRVLGAMVAALVAGRAADEVFGPDFWQWGDLHPQARSSSNSATARLLANSRARSVTTALKGSSGVGPTGPRFAGLDELGCFATGRPCSGAVRGRLPEHRGLDVVTLPNRCQGMQKPPGVSRKTHPGGLNSDAKHPLVCPERHTQGA